MRTRNVNAGELNRLADVLQTLAALAARTPEYPAIASVARAISEDVARRPETILDTARRTSLPPDLVRKLAARRADDSPTTAAGFDGGTESDWLDRCDAALDLLGAELLSEAR